jgi:RNA polymerase sigma-70 factor (ECF subfamily)
MAHDRESCEEVFALLSDYLDLELPPAACDQIESHLADCPPCIEFLDSLRKTVQLCRGRLPQAAPGPLSQEARAAIEAAWRKALAERRA